ncbi:alpha-ketoacid dehydrogenase subunit beta [Pseudoramibacter alactolyticus]|uniref:alpha-ketoacid dehydrogenase subunit beta n=1 Tax=Pseudoramibacter alactolyticus TaxID=113287 RepID=UPI00248E2C84|nr:transketolase C-terminal domain-containing protein [Pseudoramibacter alactolyticus]
MELKEMTYKEALKLALKEMMTADGDVVIFGEDVRQGGGVTLGLVQEFGEARVMDTPASESAMVGCAVGAAMTGLIPVVALRSMDQAALALGEIIGAAARIAYTSGGQYHVPLTLLIPTGLGDGVRQAGQTLEGLFAQIPGLKIVAASTPAQAKGLLKSAIADPNPVVFLMNQDLMALKSQVPANADYTLPLETAYVEHPGDDMTIVTWGASLVTVLKAMAERDDVSAEVINPMTLAPMDIGAVLASVKQTGHLLIVHEGSKTGGIGAEIAASVIESDTFDYLEAPIVRLCGLDTPMPYNRRLQDVVAPQKEDVLQAIDDLLDL